jgi:PmbA protein
MEPGELLEVCRDAVKRARDLGADQAEVYASASSEVRVHIENGDLGTAVAHDEECFGIRVRRAGATGFASSNDPSPEAVDETARAAVEIARVSPADADGDFPEPEAGDAADVKGLRDPALEEVDVEGAARLCGGLVREVRRLDPRVRIDSGWVAATAQTCAIASSTGIERAERGTGGEMLLFGMASEGDRVGAFDLEQVDVCSLSELQRELHAAPDRFVRKVVRALAAGPGESFRGSLVLSPEAVAEFLLPNLIAAFAADAIRAGRSPFRDRLGEAVFSDRLTIVDDGTLPGRPGSASFDREGISHHPVALVERGILRSFLYDTREARSAGRAEGSTGHAVGGATSPPRIGATNLMVEAGETDDAALLAGVEQGLLLNRFSGNTDPVSGDFSGVAKGSLLLKKGESPRPVQETLIAGNLYELCRSVSAIGRELRWVEGSVRAPIIRLEGASVTAG